jgi:hypothetical protein
MTVTSLVFFLMEANHVHLKCSLDEVRRRVKLNGCKPKALQFGRFVGDMTGVVSQSHVAAEARGATPFRVVGCIDRAAAAGP